MKILAIRQEGTESTGAMLFVDLETEGRFGPIEVTYELDPKHPAKFQGKVIGSAWIAGKPVHREPTPNESRALDGAWQVYLDGALSGFRAFPINVTFEWHEELNVIGGDPIPAGMATVLS